MNSVPETFIPIIQEIHNQLHGKMPEAQINQISQIISRELQYEELRHSSYQISHKTLAEIRSALQPLQNWAKEEQELWAKIEKLIQHQAQEQTNQRLQYFQTLGSDLATLRQLGEQIRTEANTHILTTEQQKIKENLLSNLPKLEQILQDIAKFSQTTKELLGTLEKNLSLLSTHITHTFEPVQQQLSAQNKQLQLLPNLAQEIPQTLQKIQLELSAKADQDTAKKIHDELNQLVNQISTLTNTNWLTQVETLLREKFPLDKVQTDLDSVLALFPKLKEFWEEFQTNIQQAIEQWQNLQDSARKEWQQTQVDVFSEWERHQTDILTQLQQSPSNIQLLQSVQEIHQALTGNKLTEIKNTLEQYQDLLLHIKKIAQQLQSLPQQLHIPENFATTIESMPDTIKKVRDYLEHFRQEIVLIGEHDLALLKASREQSVEYAKLTTSIQPQIQSLQQSWQKMSARLDDYWSSNHETFTKNMAELATALSRIKLTLEDLSHYQQEEAKRIHPTQTLPDAVLIEWKNTIAQTIDKAMSQYGSPVASQTANMPLLSPNYPVSSAQDLRLEIRRELTSLIPDLKKEMMISVGQEMRKELSNFGQEMRKDIAQAFGTLGESCAVALSKAVYPKLDAIGDDVHSLEKRLVDKIQLLEQNFQTKIQLMEQTFQGKIQLAGQASDQQRNTNSSTNSLDTRITVKCPNCGKKVSAPIGCQGKRVQCQDCRHEFIFPSLK